MTKRMESCPTRIVALGAGMLLVTAMPAQAQEDPSPRATAVPADEGPVDRTGRTFRSYAEAALDLGAEGSSAPLPEGSFLGRMPAGSIDADATEGLEGEDGGAGALSTYCVGSEGADTIVYGEMECLSANIPGTWVDYGRACCVYAFDPSGPCWRGAQRWVATVWGLSPPLPLVILGDPAGQYGAGYIMYSSYCDETTVACNYLPGRTCRLRTAAPNAFPDNVNMGICGDACGDAGGTDKIIG